MEYSAYTLKEIKQHIDLAIHLTMLHKDEGCWQALLEVQGRLYEEFGLADQQKGENYAGNEIFIKTGFD